MRRVLALLRGDSRGHTLRAMLRQLLSPPWARIIVVTDWSGVIGAFVPDEPACFIVDTRTLARELPVAELHGLKAEFPATKIVLVGDLDHVPAEAVASLIEGRSVDRVLTTDELERLDGAASRDVLLAPSLAERVREHLLDARGGRPITALLDAALEFVLDRSDGPIKVGGPEGLAACVGVSERTLNRRLREDCGFSGGQLISWGRVLRVVEELDAHPTVSAEEVARRLGFSSASALSHTLHRRMGIRVRGAREAGLRGAIEVFVQVLCSHP